MKIGGFPAALAEAGEQSLIPKFARQTILQWLRGDVVKLNKQDLFMKELVGQLVKIMGNAVSLQGLAQKTQLMSYHTVQDYLSVLEQSFALRSLYAYNPEKDSFRFKKGKKFYFTDPILFWVACEWLSRKYPRLGYYSTKEGEVDFISNGNWAVEVKRSSA